MTPIILTVLYEGFNFGKQRQEKFMKLFETHAECINDGVTSIDQYDDWCREKGYIGSDRCVNKRA